MHKQLHAFESCGYEDLLDVSKLRKIFYTVGLLLYMTLYVSGCILSMLQAIFFHNNNIPLIDDNALFLSWGEKYGFLGRSYLSPVYVDLDAFSWRLRRIGAVQPNRVLLFRGYVAGISCDWSSPTVIWASVKIWWVGLELLVPSTWLKNRRTLGACPQFEPENEL